ncbi:hypothetical protein VNO77_31086 [Canavalia gladiata]|uniref:Uncharacterized protein n=1 Tax=Canavalia gladiata TaxID=3824 RepID=A0AAN9Q7K3_CANGL
MLMAGDTEIRFKIAFEDALHGRIPQLIDRGVSREEEAGSQLVLTIRVQPISVVWRYCKPMGTIHQHLNIPWRITKLQIYDPIDGYPYPTLFSAPRPLRVAILKWQFLACVEYAATFSRTRHTPHVAISLHVSYPHMLVARPLLRQPKSRTLNSQLI